MATAPLTLEAPEMVTANAHGNLTGDQRRVLARNFYGEHWKTPAAALGWIAASVIMLRILLPVFGSLVQTLFTDNHRGLVPLRFPAFTVALPLWTMLNVFLLLLTLAYVVSFAVQVKKLVTFLHLRQTLLYGQVASVVGEVRYCKEHSYAIFADRLVRPWDARIMAGVAPGRYRFFLLPRFDWLLSAQRIHDWEHPTADEAALAARYSLSVINGFDPDALPENRAGRLTAEQSRWLRDSAPDIGWRVFVLFAAAIAIGVGGAATYVNAAMQRGFTQDRLEGIFAGGAWAAIWVAILVKQFVDNANQKRDASGGQVLVYEGVVNKWEGWRNSNGDSANVWICRYECAPANFEVSQTAFRALADGLVHRVYYTPKRAQLVNIALVPVVDERASE